MIRTSLALLATSLLLALGGSHAYECSDYYAYSAVVDSSVSSSYGGHTLYLFNTSLTNGIQQFVFSSFGAFAINDTSATLTGKLVPLGASSTVDGFNLVISFSAAPAQMGMDELLSSIEVDMSSWFFFTVSSPSYLTGFGSFAGSFFQIQQQMPTMPLQMGVGANGKNLEFGAAVWLNLISGSTTIAADININLNCTNTQSICPGNANMIATAAEVDSYAQYTGGVAVSVFDLPAAYSNFSSWVFASNSGLVRIIGDNLHLSGIIVPTASPSSGSLTVNLLFTSAPASYVDAMPHKELIASAYIENNGPIDASTWKHYFLVPSASSITDGQAYSIVLSTQMGMPLQVGYGANGKNIKLGASGWFDYTFLTFSGSLDINLDLNCTNEASSSSSSSASSSSSSSSSESSCHLTVSTSISTTWIENGRNTSLVYVTLTNTGSETITNANVKLDQHNDDCSAFAESCIRQLWSLDSSLCSSANTATCTYQLPSWITDFGGLQVAASTNWGFISYSPVTDITAQAICSTSA